MELVSFNKTYNTIIAVIAPENSDIEIKEVTDWLRVVFDYNVRSGKQSRGLAVVKTVQYILERDNCSVDENDLELARILGWTVEMLQAHFLILDDIMDNSTTRRGQICWYKQVGLNSINDAILLEQCIYQVLQMFFLNMNYYRNLVEMFHQITRLTIYGQYLDLSSGSFNDNPKFELFTQERYDSIIKYKTAYYSYVLPIRLAMYFSSCYYHEDHTIAENILLKIGHLFQVQDDYLDCFGDPNLIGKIGTDIEDGKCCWNFITALKYCTSYQLEMLKRHYGIKDKSCIKIVKEIYNHLYLNELYIREENFLYRNILRDIDDLKCKTNLNSEIFIHLLNKTYRRIK